MSEALNCYNVRIGDKLRVIKKWESEAELFPEYQNPSKDPTIGSIGVVIGVHEDRVCLKHHVMGRCVYPYEELVRVTDEVPIVETVTYTFTAPKEIFPFQPYSDVLVRDHVAYLWIRERFVIFKENCNFPYVCSVCSFKFCIPYEGNEHLEGTPLPEGTPKFSRVDCCGRCQHFHTKTSRCMKHISGDEIGIKTCAFNICSDFIVEEE